MNKPQIFLSVFLFAGIISTASAAPVYWNLFNIEGESTLSSSLITYDSLTDMLNDENRTGVLVPDGQSSGQFAGNVVGTGSDGSSYWNLFNIEGESALSSSLVTYNSLTDMLNDENRTSASVPDGQSSGQFAGNVVGTGSDGSSYW
ncbi:hypothetical protein, partial [Pelagibius sp. Alg239-R121]|uniref:hypothetical protein n=1 Tax=Pelagibius sp. Alg239-R121 TaxID=2993448 RepID=UPI0024A77D01